MLLVLLSAMGITPAGASTDSLTAIVADYEQLAAQLDGNSGFAWPDVRPAAVAARMTGYRELLERVSALPEVDPDSVDGENRALLTWRLQILIEGARFDEERIPFDNGDGFFNTAIYAAAQTVVRTEQDARDWIRRLEQLPDYYAAQIDNMRRGLATGFTQPRRIAAGLIPVLRLAADQPVDASPLFAPLLILPAAIPQATADALRADARRALYERVKPAQQALVLFFETEYIPQARLSTGARSLPDGEAYYPFLIRRSTTLPLTPEEVEDIGKREVLHLSAEMNAAMRAAGWAGTLPEFIAFLRSDPRFYAPDLQTYIEKSSEIGKRIDGMLPLWFGKLPRLPWHLRRKPPEQDASSSGYDPGDPDKGVAGSVVVGSHANRDPLFSLPAWILHEGVPGHHLQIALAQERSDLPVFRRHDDVTAFVEGWALYAESLGEEMGVYRDPYEHFGRLAFNIWRACRLVMDVAIHWHNESPEEAEQCLLEHTTLPAAVADYETARYTAWPAQALAYKIGELHILALREDAQARLGTRFDLRAFHDRLIGDGPMPLPLLAAHVDRWIKHGNQHPTFHP
jgi:uncharacterized protein (DUF885 family)